MVAGSISWHWVKPSLLSVVKIERWDGAIYTVCSLDEIGTENTICYTVPFLCSKVEFPQKYKFDSLDMKSPEKLKHMTTFCKTVMAKFNWWHWYIFYLKKRVNSSTVYLYIATLIIISTAVFNCFYVLC